MKVKPPEITSPTTRPGPAQIELRVWLDSALHERILLEAAARGGSASKAVREGMREYFALKDGLVFAAGENSPTQTCAPPGDSQPQPRLAHPIVRLIEQHAAHDQKLDSISQRLSALACMIDQAYQGLVGRIGEVPAPLRARRAAAAEESAKRWRAAVSKLLRQQKYKLLDALSDPDHHE